MLEFAAVGNHERGREKDRTSPWQRRQAAIYRPDSCNMFLATAGQSRLPWWWGTI